LNRAIEMLQRAEAPNIEGTAWNNLDYIERDLGNLQQALTCHQKALVIFEQADDSKGMVRTLLETGIVHKDLGHVTQARIDLERAIDRPLDRKMHCMIVVMHSQLWVSYTNNSTTSNMPSGVIGKHWASTGKHRIVRMRRWYYTIWVTILHIWVITATFPYLFFSRRCIMPLLLKSDRYSQIQSYISMRPFIAD
jgi:tetratricopeptide (TPR) repeat protein